jgi:hypothetical protein
MMESFSEFETEIGWGKYSIHDDCSHVLMAIIEGLSNQLQWPDEDRRFELADMFKGIFKKNIGICDVKEFQVVVKHQDPLKERIT